MGSSVSKQKASNVSTNSQPTADSAQSSSGTNGSDNPPEPSQSTISSAQPPLPGEADSQPSIDTTPTLRPRSSQDPVSISTDADPPPSQSDSKLASHSHRLETPGVKQVEVISVNNPENYEDETNQTGLSHYEMKIIESFYSVPERPRSKAYTEAKQAAVERRAAREERKAAKLSRRKSKSKSAPQPPVVHEPNTVSWALENTKKLGILNLSKMDLTEVPDEVFESMPGTARIINVAFNNLAVLDVRVCDYVLVQRLIANGNLLSSIPPAISRMTALKKLDLAHNKLTELPDSFSGMRFLEYVDLSENHLSSLPPSFSALNLTALNLSRNKFSEAPLGISTMELLMDLDLSYNMLRVVPKEYVKLCQLISLNMDNNQILDFPNEILEACTELVTLRLRGNPITLTILEQKEAFGQFDSRRKMKFKRQLDAGGITLADLVPADS